MIETGTILQNRYLIEKQIGAGGMGAVYRAVDQRFESFVAIKETFYQHDELGDAFEREAKLLNGLHHPNLPHVSDYFTEGGGHFLVMQFVEGEDLFEILKREGAFPLPDVLRWTFSLLDALDYLHSHEPPVIHRDIKPQNLKITKRGDVILLDFGLAKLNAEDTLGVKSVFGYSRKYSPLEQIQGTGTDARSDIFALGATAYHLLTGKPPLDALTRATAIVAGKPDPLPLASEINSEVPLDIAHVLRSAMKLNADQRFASAKAMRQALGYTAVPDSAENIQESPEQILAAAPANEIINSAETESFPALEAFAAETANASLETNGSDQTAMVEIPAVNAQTPLSEGLTHATDVATRISLRPKQSRFPLAALAALLICAVAAAGYFINNANSATDSNQTPVAETTSEANPNAEQIAIVSESPAPQISDVPQSSELPPANDTVKAGVKPRPVEKSVEKKEIVREPATITETVEKPKPAPVENSRSVQTQAARRSQAQRNGETRSRVVETAPVSDIESVFTGQPSEREKMQRKDDRRRQRGEMSEQELRELRRERRERRRERNRPPFPF